MKRLRFKKEIDAPIAEVYTTMLGLHDKVTYEAWASAWDPTSTYEGSWEKGTKIRFVGTGEEGKKSGMLCIVVENIPNQFVSLRPYGILQDDIEITEGEEAEKWIGGVENYTFEENDGMTTVTVDIDLDEEYVAYFDEMYRKALDLLKSTVEN